MNRKLILLVFLCIFALLMSACGGKNGGDVMADAVVTTELALKYSGRLSRDMNGMMVVTDDNRVLVDRRTGYSWFDGAKEWTDIVAVSVGYNSAFGLKIDGTVVGAWSLAAENTDLSAFVNVKQISANNRCVYGLKADGMVVSAGSGALDLSSWSNVKQLSAGGDSTQIVIALKNDGTVLVSGVDEVMSAAAWTDIVQVSAGRLHVAGVKKDGTVVVAGRALGDSHVGEFNVGTWRDIVYVSADNQTTVGLKKDGTVVMTGRNKVESSAEWVNVMCVDQGSNSLIGVDKDGKILIPGNRPDWTLSGQGTIESSVSE